MLRIRRRFCGVAVLAISTVCALPSLAWAGFPGPGPTTPPFSQCPAVGSSTSCSFLIRLTGSSSNPTTIVTGDPPNEFYDDGLDDEIVAVQNETDGPIASIHLGIAGSGDRLFGFEDDGLCNPGRGAVPTGCPFSTASTPEVSYMGPGMTFEPGYTADDGTIDFNPPLQPGEYTFFGLDAPCTGNSCDVEIPTGHGNDYLSSQLTEAANSSNSGAHVFLSAPANVTDQATLNGAHVSSAAGTIIYKVYTDPGCSTLVTAAGSKHFASGSPIPASNPVGGDTSKFSNNAEYYWQVSFTPDPGNANTATTSTCGGETMIFGHRPARPTTGIATALSDGVHSGAQLSVPENTPVTDSATITGTSPNTATGTVTYSVYSDSSCSQQEQVFHIGGDFRKVSAGAAPASAAVTLPLGKHYFVATYSGDTSHAAAIGHCGDEIVTVKKPTALAASVSLRSTTPPRLLGTNPTISPGTPISDTASVLSGGAPGYLASGTVAYALYDASKDPTCVKTPAATLTTASVFAGAASAFAYPTLPVLKPGKWLVVISYSGDDTYMPATLACGAQVITVRPYSIGSFKPTVASGTIINVLHPNGAGKITISGSIRNATALAAAKRCRHGTARVKGNCVSTTFGIVRIRVLAAGRHVVKLKPSAAARRALSRGRTLTVVETITFRPSDGSKTVAKSVRVTVKPPKHKKRR